MRTIICIITGILLGVLANSAFANGEGLWGDYAKTGELSSSGVGSRDVRRIGNVLKGTLVEARPIVITIESGNAAKAAGASIGAAVGGIVGHKAGNSSYAVAALLGTVGGIVGGIAGDMVGTERKQGVEMIVLLDNGTLVSVSQEAAGTSIPQTGSEVFVATVNGVARVYPAASTRRM